MNGIRVQVIHASGKQGTVFVERATIKAARSRAKIMFARQNGLDPNRMTTKVLDR
jgi:hypothetical protein